MSDEERRFWANVTGRWRRGCWVWKGPRDGSGYGRFRDEHGRDVAARRWAYARTVEFSFGRLRHTCGNRACVNPAHLREKGEEVWWERFRSKVAFGALEECWEWTGAKTAGGYGVLRVDGETCYAHHLMWEFKMQHELGQPGRVPQDIPLGHTCGDHGCVNPGHLVSKRDSAFKLDERDVADIRRRSEAGELQSRLAAEYGVSASMVSRIIKGTRWPPEPR